MRIPQHLAIIMDGNGRWAEQRRLPRIAGHRRGVEAVHEIVTACREIGVANLTLFAFSSENWGRPDDEVSALMSLLGHYLRRELKTMLDNRIRLNIIGQIERLPENVTNVLRETISKTSGNHEMTLTLALSYGSRNELVRAVRRIAEKVVQGEISPEQIDEVVLSSSLDTAGLPDPDLLIRTSGEMRISNFLLWQLAYTELVFSEQFWPDFNRQALLDCLEEFSGRERRFGLTGAQISPKKR